VGKKPASVCVSAGSAACRRKQRKAAFATRTHSHQSCEATNRNLIQGRFVQVSQPTLSETISFGRIGKSRACAAKVSRFIQGRLHACVRDSSLLENRRRLAKATRRVQFAAEVVVLTR
jgi:hypothetical protein